MISANELKQDNMEKLAAINQHKINYSFDTGALIWDNNEPILNDWPLI